MNRRFYLVVSIVMLIGIQPIFAQSDESAETAVPEEKAVRTEKTIDMESVSDNEFTEALEASSDVELVNKYNVPPSEKQPVLTEDKPAAEKPDLAEQTPAHTESVATEQPAASTGQEAPGDIGNNQYLLESERLTRLAEEAYNYGDYDASAGFAEAAIHNAELSDEYIAGQTGITTAAPKPAADGTFPLPASYTVRAWSVSHDCFWNIAGRPWVYGNPRQWRVLYNANKAKLPNPNNPNLIEPGTVLEIPSLKGEVRQGAWDGNKTYKPLQ